MINDKCDLSTMLFDFVDSVVVGLLETAIVLFDIHALYFRYYKPMSVSDSYSWCSDGGSCRSWLLMTGVVIHVRSLRHARVGILCITTGSNFIPIRLSFSNPLLTLYPNLQIPSVLYILFYVTTNFPSYSFRSVPFPLIATPPFANQPIHTFSDRRKFRNLIHY